MRGRLVAVTVLLAATVACDGPSSGAKSLTLYTCATENVEQAVVHAFEKANSGVTVNVYRAATGELNARVAADLRSGGIKADVIWACDPLTMHGYDAQGLLRAWRPADAAQIPRADRTAHFAGIDVLYMVLVVHKGTAAPSSWGDLVRPPYRAAVALPSPTFAASALGLLGYLSASPQYGIGYYQRLKANGAVQVEAPTDTLVGVEQGTYRVGVTLANAAYIDQQKGSPIDVVWPHPGGVAIYAPIGVTTKKNLSPVAASFASFAASRAGQKLMAAQDTYVTLPGMGGPPIPKGAATVAPDWPKLFGDYKSVLAAYTKIFPG